VLGNGDGTFQPPQDITFPPLSGLLYVTDADFNNDGVLDLAVTSQFTNRIIVMLGNGDGTFGPMLPTEVLLPTNQGPSNLAVGDINGDGILDMVDDMGSVLLGNGDGTFRNVFETNLGGSGAVVIDDFDGDGLRDVAISDLFDREVRVALGNGDGTFGPATVWGTGGFSRNLFSFDFNRDGKIDLAVLTNSPNQISFLFNNTP